MMFTNQRNRTAHGGVEAMMDAAVLAQFESLGDNCEFGIVQDTCGVRADGLLAYARTPPDALIEMLRSNLEMASDPGSLRLAERAVESGAEYLLTNERYGNVYHLASRAPGEDLDELVRSEARRLQRRELALREKLAWAESIFVIKCNEDLSDCEAGDVLDQLSRYGRNALLYVVKADAAYPEGSVIRVAENLYRGHIGRFASYSNAYDTDVRAWTAICRKALHLHCAVASVAPV